MNGTLFFDATDASQGSELWKSNGTAAGTVMVADIIPARPALIPMTWSTSMGRCSSWPACGANGGVGEQWDGNRYADGDRHQYRRLALPIPLAHER